MAASDWSTLESVVGALQVEIVVSAPGLRVFLSPEEYPGYQADPMAYIANEFRTTPERVGRFIGSGGEIQCMHIRSNGKRCRNMPGGLAAPGQIELKPWLELDASGWYCHLHCG